MFTSWGRETVRKYTMDEMRDILMKLTDTDEYGTDLRAKGMVPDENGTWIQKQTVYYEGAEKTDPGRDGVYLTNLSIDDEASIDLYPIFVED